MSGGGRSKGKECPKGRWMSQEAGSSVREQRLVKEGVSKWGHQSEWTGVGGKTVCGEGVPGRGGQLISEGMENLL